MLPPETRLMPLCLRFLQINHLDETPSPYQFEVEVNPAHESIPKVDPGTIPILLKINNDLVHDNFYRVKATYDKAMGLVQHGVIKVLSWTFEIVSGTLELKIQKAITMSNAVTNEQVLTPLEHNSKIKAAMQKIRHSAVRRLARDRPVVVAEDTESDISENSALRETQLAKLYATPPQKQTQATTPSPVVDVPMASLDSDVYSLGRRPLVPEPMDVEAPVDIGRGVKNKENAEEFSRSRKRKSPLLSTQDDLLTTYQPKKIKEPDLFKQPRLTPQPKAPELPVHDDLDIDRFPDYALEFLRYYYKL